MTYEREELVEQQADIVGLLIHHVDAPLVEDQYVRGVLPAPSAMDAVRVVLGDKGEYAPDRLRLW
ncbi:hypothetical protein [Streptomyces rimosus]|uniref:hypothetical protein n=1 Tax=Streptomyces rimosus TaxID=1927 RepID=UPI00131D49F5|nr:hypothetical protein [Streptomyces rimosus]